MSKLVDSPEELRLGNLVFRWGEVKGKCADPNCSCTEHDSSAVFGAVEGDNRWMGISIVTHDTPIREQLEAQDAAGHWTAMHAAIAHDAILFGVPWELIVRAEHRPFEILAEQQVAKDTQPRRFMHTRFGELEALRENIYGWDPIRVVSLLHTLNEYARQIDTSWRPKP